MDAFRGREHDFNNNIGTVMGNYAMGILGADALSKDAYVGRVERVAALDNAEFKLASSIAGGVRRETEASVPYLSLVNLRPMVIKSAKIEMDMTVSSHEEEAKTIEAGAEGEGSASIGVGPFSVGIKVSAQMSYSENKSRSSDYRARTHAELEMGQDEMPESLALIIETLNRITARDLGQQEGVIVAAEEAVPEAA